MRLAALAALLIAACLLLYGPPPLPSTGESAIRRALRSGATIELPAGVTEIQAEIDIPPNTRGLEIRGAPSGSTLRAAGHFRGRAVFCCEHAFTRVGAVTGTTDAASRAALSVRARAARA